MLKNYTNFNNCQWFSIKFYYFPELLNRCTKTSRKKLLGDCREDNIKIHLNNFNNSSSSLEKKKRNTQRGLKYKIDLKI